MFVFLLRQLTDHSSLHFGNIGEYANIHSVLKLSNLQLGSGRTVQVETSVVMCVSRPCQLRNENDVLRSTLCTVSDEICAAEDLSQCWYHMTVRNSENRKKEAPGS